MNYEEHELDTDFKLYYDLENTETENLFLTKDKIEDDNEDMTTMVFNNNNNTIKNY